MGQQATLSLADSAAGLGDRGLAVDLRRADIETALGSADDGLVELLLDLRPASRMAARPGATRWRSAARRPIWSGSRGVGRQHPSQLRRGGVGARDPRPRDRGSWAAQKMAVVAVVVATTGAAAGGAQAMPTLGGQSGGSGGTTVTSTRDMPADSISASVASIEGAPATRANPGQAAAAVAAASEAPSTRQGPYWGGAPFQDPQATTHQGSTLTTQSCPAAITWRRR